MIYQRLLKIEQELDKQEKEIRDKRLALKSIKKLLTDNIDENYEVIPERSLKKLRYLLEDLKQTGLSEEEIKMINLITDKQN
jgi:hypothetical protein